MCRWLIYSGIVTDIKSLLWMPSNSIFKQTFKKTFTPNISNSRDHEINVDGFGISWYHKKKLFLYKNNLPPWNDYNILNISEYIKSNLIFAHIRAIKPFSSNSIVNYQNCHPFNYFNFTWMHNGDIKHNIELEKYVYSNCNDDLLKLIKGNTDSEYMFYIFISLIPERYKNKKYLPINIIKEVFLNTLKLVNQINKYSSSSMNIAFSDGKTIICSRYINSKNDTPPSLYYSYNSLGMKSNADVNEKKNIIISSEPIEKKSVNWKLIPKNKLLIYTTNNNLKIHKINLI